MPRLWHDGSPLITCDHGCHLRRGSLGGEDYAVREGTPVFAPVAGTYRFHLNGTGGYTITGVPADAALRGFVVQVLHLSRAAHLILGGAARYYPEGALVGYSGGRPGHPGAGSSTGPHTHEHGIVAGIRRGMREVVERMRALLPPPPPKPNPTPTDPDPEEYDDMSKPIQIHHVKAGAVIRAVWVPGTSYFLRWQANDPSIANGFSAAGMGASVEVTESMYNAIERECDDMKQREIGGVVNIAAPAGLAEVQAAVKRIEQTLAGIAGAITGGNR